jgi:hypothetical protein
MGDETKNDGRRKTTGADFPYDVTALVNCFCHNNKQECARQPIFSLRISRNESINHFPLTMHLINKY